MALLKKQSLSSGKFKNFRPISKLGFLSKVVEKCVAKPLIGYLDASGLNVLYQSAFRKLHSTETVFCCSLIFPRHLRLWITVSYFQAFLVDLELVVRHWNGFDCIWVIALSL